MIGRHSKAFSANILEMHRKGTLAHVRSSSQQNISSHEHRLPYASASKLWSLLYLGGWQSRFTPVRKENQKEIQFDKVTEE
jgi:hypothetical protein